MRSDTTPWLSQKGVVVKGNCSSISNVVIHDSSSEVCAKLLYFALVLEWTIITCSLQDHQDIKLEPRKIVAPDIYLLSLTPDAQSASQKAFKDVECPSYKDWRCTSWNNVSWK